MQTAMGNRRYDTLCLHPARIAAQIEPFSDAEDADIQAEDSRTVKEMVKASTKLRDAILWQRDGIPPVKRMAKVAPAKDGERNKHGPIVLGATWTEIVAGVARFYVIRVDDMMGRDRSKRFVRARSVAMLILHRRGNTLAQIGRWFGRDHTTVLHLVRKAEGGLRREEMALVQAGVPK